MSLSWPDAINQHMLGFPGGVMDKFRQFFNAIYTGSGSPEGVVVATPGSFYLDTTSGILYSKTTGLGNTGWSAYSLVIMGSLLTYTRARGISDATVLSGGADIGPAVQDAINAGVFMLEVPAGTPLLNSQVVTPGGNSTTPAGFILRGQGPGATALTLGIGLGGAATANSSFGLCLNEVVGQTTTPTNVYAGSQGTEGLGASASAFVGYLIENMTITTTTAAAALAARPCWCVADHVGVVHRNVSFDSLFIPVASVRYCDGMGFEDCKVTNGKKGTGASNVSDMYFQAGTGDNVWITHCKGGNSACMARLSNARGVAIGPCVGGSYRIINCEDVFIFSQHFDADQVTSSTFADNGAWLDWQQSHGVITNSWWDAPFNTLTAFPWIKLTDANAGLASDLTIDNCRGNITLDSTRAGDFRLGDLNIAAVQIGTTVRLRHAASGGVKVTGASNPTSIYITCAAGMTAMTAQLKDPAFLARLTGNVDLVVETMTTQADAVFVIREAGGETRQLRPLTRPTCSISAISTIAGGSAVTRNYAIIPIDAAGRAAGYVTSLSQALLTTQSAQVVMTGLTGSPHSILVLEADGAADPTTAPARYAIIGVGPSSSVTFIDSITACQGLPWIATGVPTVATFGLDSATRNWTNAGGTIGASVWSTAGALASVGLTGPVMIRKTADTTVATGSTVPVNDADLQLWLPAGRYRIEALAAYVGTQTTGRIKFGWSSTAGRTGFWQPRGLVAGATTVTAATQSQSDAWTASEILGAVTGIDTVASLLGEINLTTAGVFALQWSQADNTVNPTTLRADSLLRAEPVAV